MNSKNETGRKEINHKETTRSKLNSLFFHLF